MMDDHFEQLWDNTFLNKGGDQTLIYVSRVITKSNSLKNGFRSVECCCFTGLWVLRDHILHAENALLY